MNRSFRSTLNRHANRAYLILTFAFIMNLAFGQISNCPSNFVNLTVDNAGNCTADFVVTPAITAGGTATFTSTGATETTMMESFSSLVGYTFNHGVSEITLIDGMENCVFTVIVTEAAVDFSAVCADVIIDLEGECSTEYTLPDDVAQNSVSPCEAGDITFSFSNTDPSSKTTILDYTMVGTNTVTVFVAKNGDIGSCSIDIELTDDTPIVPALSCPSDLTIQIAPTCAAVYTFDVDSGSVFPCDGMINQTLGAASGTTLTAGSYPYAFDLVDNSIPMTVDMCNWNVEIIESGTAGSQVNCLGQINISLDQTCEAIVIPTTLLAGSICSDISMFTVAATLPGGTELSGSSIIFTQDQLGMDIDVSVFDENGVNSCWGTVTIEDKVAPIIMCPADITLSCTMETDTSVTGLPTLMAGMGMNQAFQSVILTLGSCSVEAFYSDAVQNNLCDGDYQQIISRTWYAVDNAGNRSLPCTQTISVTREDIDAADYPPHWDGIAIHSGISDNMVTSNPPLACDGEGTVWAAVEREDGVTVPSPFDVGTVPGTGSPSGIGSCGTIFSFYEDIIIDICNEDGCSNYNPSYKVLRTWDVFDWCTGEFRLHEQLIKVLDTVPPVFTDTIPDMTISTDIWGCGTTIILPDVAAVDQCSNDINYYWTVSGGTYDPVQNTVYVVSEALTTLGNEVELIATAEDCCGNLSYDTAYVTIVDLVAPVVIADEHTVVSLNNQEDDGSTKVHVDSFDDGSFDGCGPIDWWIRRMDTACVGYDGLDENGIADSTEIDEINDWQKYIHFCCEDVEEQQMVVFMVCDDADRDGIPEFNGDDNCGTAMIIVDVQDKLAPTIVCPADKTINCIDFVVFEDLIDVALDSAQIEFLNAQFDVAYTTSTCGVIGGQTFSGDDFCGVGTATRAFTATTSNGTASCLQTIHIRTGIDNVLSCDRISFPTLSLAPNNYNWCDPQDIASPFVMPVQIMGCSDFDIEEPVIDRDNLCTQVGISVTLDTFVFADGGCMKILAHWEVIDQCLFEENWLNDDEIDPFVNDNGYYEIYIEYDIFDTEGPVVDCTDLIVDTEDCEINNDVYSLSATDECTPDESISYVYKVDFGADGTFDYPADTSFAQGNSFDASLVGGLPIGEHAIRWVTYDGCGNYTICVQHIEVVRRLKEPTPYCYLGLSSAVMDSINGCNLELWASDFVPDQGTGACGEVLTYVMIPYQDIYGDPANPDDDLSADDAYDMAEPNWTFGCEYIENGVSHVIDIRIYAVDENGIYDYCDASLTLNDNFDCCTDLEIGELVTSVAGNIVNEDGVQLEGIKVSIDADLPEFPRNMISSAEGSFIFNNVKMANDYKISAYNNDKTKSGVSTLDLVLIQRHLLGITMLDSPYKLIAADINNNEDISAVDLLQLRKLILGLYPNDHLPNNTSWKFLDNGYEFVDPSHPFPYNEVVHVNDLSQMMFNQNFIGVKVGDVNGSIALSTNENAQVRELKTTDLEATDQVFKKNEIISVPLKVSDVTNLYGLQLGFEYDETKMSFSGVQSENINISEEHLAIGNGYISVSWNEIDLHNVNAEEVLFIIEFKAIAESKLSESLRLSDEVLSSEIYTDKLLASSINLEFRNVEVAEFELMQNQPNPFSNKTSISFVIPEAGVATMKVYDVSGKVLLKRENKFEKGLNSFVINGNELNIGGILYYQVSYNNHQETRKMILLD